MATIFPDAQKPAPVSEQPEQKEATRLVKRARRLWWQHPVIAYGVTVLMVAIAAGVVRLGDYFLQHYYFPSTVSLMVAILCSALFWGVGPGLLATVLGCAALSWFYFYTENGYVPFHWEMILPLGLFVIAGLVVVMLTRQREVARQQAQQAQQVAQRHAANLARTNEELLQANQLKDFFVSIASHELKTPITTIRGQAQLSLRRLKKSTASSPEFESFRETLVSIDEQTKRVTELLNELLDLSGLRSGKMILNKEPCNLNEICSRVVEEQSIASGRVIDLRLPSCSVVLQADAQRLRQVVTNLVNNALKYSSPESSVHVKVESDDTTARLLVQDAGRGIAPEQLTNLFKPFYRTPDARASAVGGTGLGLAICKEIVENHRGRIWAESSPGHGSRFFVDLPLHSPD
jgi:signal transduction histidine kinase